MKQLTIDILNRWRELKPQRDAVKDQLARKFSIEFNYNSNHIEGNTLTYGQTEILLLFGRVIGEAKMFDLEEMKAHNVGLKMVLSEAVSDNPFTETFIRQMHKILLREDYEVYRNLPGGVTTSYTVHAGCYKTRPNSVITPSGERFEYASPEETPGLMTDLVKWYREEEAKEELNPLELAALFHYRYIRIHPFEDGNGRIARLMMNFILARHDYPLIVVPTKTKRQYLEALSAVDKLVGTMPSDGANASLKQVKAFVDYLERLMTVEMQTDMVVAEGTGGQWWYSGGWVRFDNPNVVEIINQLISDPSLSISELAEILDINRSAVQKHMKFLQEKGYIIRSGARKTGKWQVVLTKL
ncbi:MULTISPECIES: Fic family protein [Bacteroidales]|uniref:Fic family protein n=1 Tax=Xylanibacter muris TaxID=2736290 RepID=A0ABX2ASU5_9BACT|nr:MULTISPECIES: Fic family protein [Bacteroidales]NPD93269.1 Fic family protein [Xylanibacter muris]